MEQYIITERCKTLRMLGREALRGRWKMAFCASLLYYLLMYIPSFISALPIPFASAIVLDVVYPVLVTGPLLLGFSIFALCLFRNEEPSVGQVMYGFERFVKAFLLIVLVCLFTFLWSLLFIVPGIIAAIRYSQAFFILADHPETGVLDCIGRSKEMMAGNKGKYFLLSLSFIGWSILAGLPYGLVNQVFTSQHTNDIISMQMNVNIGIQQIWDVSAPTFSESALLFLASFGIVLLEAYIFATMAAFYEMASGNLKPGYIASTAEIISETERATEEDI